MPSRLSSLLVRDGLVGVKRMEKAFQRQVIYGGTLDTILLEMSLVPEERLTQYLALASGLPPAARDEGSVIEPAATQLVSRELAEQYRAVPLSIDGEAVRMLVCAPLELTELENLADLLDRPLQPLITPEYRWHLVFAAAYGLDEPARYATLARALDVDAPPAPVGRGTSVIVEEPAPALARTATPPATGVPVPVALVETQPTGPTATPATAGAVLAPISPDEATLKMVVAEAPDSSVPGPELGAPGPEPAEDGGRLRRATMLGVNPNRAITEAGTGSPARLPATEATGTLGPAPAPRTIALTMVSPDPARARAQVGPVRTIKKPIRVETAPLEELGKDSPLPIVHAREMLATAADRDAVFMTLLRACRSRARYAGLLAVQGGAAIGRVALAESGIDVAAIASVLIPLDAMSPFRSVVTNQQPHIGPITAGNPAIDPMIRRFGGTTPTSVLLLPIVLRGRTVAVVVAHRLHHDIKLIDVTELLPLASATADALSRLIVKHKAAGYRAPTDHAVVAIEADQIDTKRLAREAGPWRAPDGEVERPSVPVLEQRTELTITAEPPRSMDEVLAEIERATESGAEDAIADAVERAPEALGALMRRFPGRLRVDRFSVGGRALRAAQYGGLLELCVRLGSVAAELLIDKMAAPQRDVRFYATVCAAELRPRSAVYALVERVFDQDFGVRAMALEALSGYPMQDLANAMSRARRAVRSTDPEVVLAATRAIVELGDIEAIGDLISVVETPGRSGEHARKALVGLTAQDFGASERKWRKWWEGAKSKHRIEWLIDGLVHKEDAVREAAIGDLRRLTGEYFGYHHDLPRRERDLAAERWSAWWRESGQRRFVAREDERLRPTGVLPARRTTET